MMVSWANTNDDSLSTFHATDIYQDYLELYKYACLASVAYCASQNLQKGMISDQPTACPSPACKHPYVANLDIIETFDFDGIFDVGSGFVALDKELKIIYLSFRGTSSTQDWINNLGVLQVEYQPLVSAGEDFKVTSQLKCVGCKVHKGFSSFLKLNGHVVVRSIIKLKNQLPCYRIIVAGHSLGAALSMFTGIELRLLGYEVLVVTLGGPKIGNKNFAEFTDVIFETEAAVSFIEEMKSFGSLSVGLIRIVHTHDIIPFLPPTHSYVQSGYEYFLSAEGLNQNPSTIDRRGLDYMENSMSYWKLIPEFRRIHHSSYFLPISTCA